MSFLTRCFLSLFSSRVYRVSYANCAYPSSVGGVYATVPCSTRASIEEREAVQSYSDAADLERFAANRDPIIKHSTSLLRIVAKYVRKDRVWCIVSSVISGDRGGKRQAYNRCTAYRVMDLANHVTGLISDQPDATGGTIRDAFRGYVSELGALKGMCSRGFVGRLP